MIDPIEFTDDGVMTKAWRDHLASLDDDDQRAEAQSWFDTLPAPPRFWAERCPLGTEVRVQGSPAYAVGFNGMGIFFSRINPREDWDRARAEQFLVVGLRSETPEGPVTVPDDASIIPGDKWPF